MEMDRYKIHFTNEDGSYVIALDAIDMGAREVVGLLNRMAITEEKFAALKSRVRELRTNLSGGENGYRIARDDGKGMSIPDWYMMGELLGEIDKYVDEEIEDN